MKFSSVIREKLPTCGDYGKLLCYACEKFHITDNQARDRYGLYTYGQWEKLLGISYIEKLGFKI